MISECSGCLAAVYLARGACQCNYLVDSMCKLIKHDMSKTKGLPFSAHPLTKNDMDTSGSLCKILEGKERYLHRRDIVSRSIRSIQILCS